VYGTSSFIYISYSPGNLNLYVNGTNFDGVIPGFAGGGVLNATTGWTQLVMTKDGTGAVAMYQDGVSIKAGVPGEATASGIIDATKLIQVGIYSSGTFYDLRIIDGIVSI
jgi:hypothetical protein